MINRTEKPAKYALDLQNDIIKSAKTLQKYRSLLRHSLAEAEKRKTFLHIPGKKFASFVKYLKYLAPKTKISVKHMRKLAKAGAAEALLIKAGINTANMSDISLITLGQNVPKEHIVNVFHTAVDDNSLEEATPSESQIIAAAEKLGVFKQKNRNNTTNQSSSQDPNETREEADNTYVADNASLPSQKSSKDTGKGKDKATSVLPIIQAKDRHPKSNSANSVGIEIAGKFNTKNAKALAALFSNVSELFANPDHDKNVIDEGMRMLKEYPLNELGEISESISRVMARKARNKTNRNRTASQNKIKKRKQDNRLKSIRNNRLKSMRKHSA